MRVLIIKVSSMGDVLHTLPSLTDSMYLLPNIQFDWVVEEQFSEIPTWHPSVKEIIPIGIRRWRNNLLNISSYQEWYKFKSILQKYNYDKVIDAQGLIKSAILITYIARGEKHGMDYKSSREPFSSCFYDYCHTIDKNMHAIERIRYLFASSLGYKVPIKTADYSIYNYFINKYNYEPHLIFLHATTCPNKQWPKSHWRTLISFACNAGYRISLPWGTEKERQYAEELKENFNCVEVLPKLSLCEIAKKIIGASAVVSVDTGLSHLTAALNCYNLTLYGPTKPKLIGVYGQNQNLLCSVDNKMDSIKAEDVWSRLIDILSIKKSV